MIKTKNCPEGKVLNPKTGRCIKKENLEKQTKKAKPAEPPAKPIIKECPEGKVLNPKTGRCIKKENLKKQTKKTNTGVPSVPVVPVAPAPAAPAAPAPAAPAPAARSRTRMWCKNKNIVCTTRSLTPRICTYPGGCTEHVCRSCKMCRNHFQPGIVSEPREIYD